ncbi:MAG: DUF6036 family nucleotidyltransferase [Euzebya sp.]
MFSAEQIRRLLGLLAQELHAGGHTAELFLVGGAAMAVAYDRDRATRDLDAVFEPKTIVDEAAHRVARAEGIQEDWLNDAVKGFLPGEDPSASVLMDLPGLRVRVASPLYLFALKAMAARAERDADDLLILYRLCDFADVEAALDAVQTTLGPMPLTPKTAYLLRELLQKDR